ncbi:hypothetical protein SLS59_008957 [Nothophoma quercina]|uniref:Cytochrome P450 n=1 Tax=Nothophoma quercina TaxID=749835 RepID=A0ABR3QQ52_9PLEO
MAGTATSAHYLKTTAYHILANPSVLHRLNTELKTCMANPAELPPFNTLNNLPYLNAVVNEGFRLSHGVITRLQRIAPTENLQVPNTSFVIPAGTPISMSSWLIHLNPELFPEPDNFRPERWLEPGAENLKKYLVNFSRGSRICLDWEEIRDDVQLARVLEVDVQKPTSAFRVCFIDTLKTKAGWLPGNFSARPETVSVLRRAGLSGILLSNLYSEESYWAKMGNQRFMRYNDDGDLQHYGS